jgi:hypothetical protein
MKITTINTLKIIPVSFFILGPFLYCSNPTKPLVEYNPPVTFNGFLNGKEVSLRGNFYWPNCCTLKNDTVRMYFYSDTFSEKNKIRNGDFMRIFFFPSSDTLLGLRHMIFHLARYQQFNSSYTIAPKDSVSFVTKAQMHRVALSPTRGKEVHIDEIYMCTGPVSGSTGEQLEIKKGIIKGVVE